MKNILFVSRSRLAHNLFQAVLSLVSVKVQLECVENAEDAAGLLARGRGFSVALLDWNSLRDRLDSQLEALEKNTALKATPRILLHPFGAELPKDLLQSKGFKAFHPKPFLAEELAELVTQHLRQ